jgi:sigma-E factor negative regulatory protein RseA
MNTPNKDESADDRAWVERVSSLIDGELDPAEMEALVSTLCSDPALLQKWQELHRVGDALRSTEVAAFDHAGFCAGVAARIAAEPTVLAPRPSSGSRLKRFWIPGVAVAASVAAIGFVAVPLLRAPAVEVAQTADPARVETAASEAARRPAAIANARALEAYFSAHRELTGGSAMPRAAAYLRPIENEDR